MAFADEQSAFQRRNIIPEGIPTILELAASEQRLHPVVMPGQMIETRDGRWLHRARDDITKTNAIPPGAREHGSDP